MVWGRSREHHTVLPASAYSFTFFSQSSPRPHGSGWHALSSVSCDASLRIPSAGVSVSSRCITMGRHLSSAAVRCALLGNTSGLFSPRRDLLREMAPPGRGCVVWTVDLVSAPSYPRHPRHLPRPHHQSHTAHDTVELLARGHRRSSCTCNIKNNSTPPRHPVSSPVASRVSALLPPVGRDAVKPSSVPDDVGAKCSGSCGLW